MKRKILNPKFFDKNLDIRKNVRIKLLQIARSVVKELNIINPMLINDIVLTGSIANYNWTKSSDIDLHIIVPYNKINKDIDLVKELFSNWKYKWHDEHDIQIFGHNVEVYFEDYNVENNSTGIYSLIEDRWLKLPSTRKKMIDITTIRKKYSQIVSYIKDLKYDYYQLSNQTEYENYFDKVKRFKDKIYKYRQEGLTKNKEYSIENIVFKRLRRKGYIDLIFKLLNKSYDGIFSEAKSIKLVMEAIKDVKNPRHWNRNLIGSANKNQNTVAKLHTIDNTKNQKIEDLKKKRIGIKLLNTKDIEQLKAFYDIGELTPDNPRKLGSTGITILFNPGLNVYYAQKSMQFDRKTLK